MAEATPRVLVDANVWVSAVINPAGAPARVVDAFRADRFVAVTFRALLNEIHQVLHRPRIRLRWTLSDDEVARVLDLLADRAIGVIPTGDPRLCRDPDDDIFAGSRNSRWCPVLRIARRRYQRRPGTYRSAAGTRR